jgi:D-serine deaminase-like pyridoxal phosphate-dependent protein
MTSYEYYKGALGDHGLPAALVDMELFERNLQAILKRAAGKPVRMATKSVRCLALIRHALAFDSQMQGLMCFHAREACMLAANGLDDLLVAYPTVQPGDIDAVCEQIHHGARITLMVDCPEHVERLADIAERHGVRLPLCLDVDMSLRLPGLNFGVFRSPVRGPEDALAVWEACRKRDAVVLEGVMGYEAQIAGVTDAMPGQGPKNRVVRFLKKRSIKTLTRRRDDVVRALKEAGAPLRFVNGGGTGSLESTVQDTEVTEVTAGSGLYSPGLFDYYHNFRHAPAALFALEVVRRPDMQHVTCLGGGYIASGGVGADKQPKPVYPEGLALEANEGAGEVQTPLTGPVLPGLGEPVFFRHAKAGELCERFNTLLLVRDGKVDATVPSYRGQGWQFV